MRKTRFSEKYLNHKIISKLRSQPAYELGRKDLNPRNGGVRVHCLTAWRRPSLFCVCHLTTFKLYHSTVPLSTLFLKKIKKIFIYKLCTLKTQLKPFFVSYKHHITVKVSWQYFFQILLTLFQTRDIIVLDTKGY